MYHNVWFIIESTMIVVKPLFYQINKLNEVSNAQLLLILKYIIKLTLIYTIIRLLSYLEIRLYRSFRNQLKLIVHYKIAIIFIS